jgi:hypothetical protein
MAFLRRVRATSGRRALVSAALALMAVGAATVDAGCGSEERPRGVGTLPVVDAGDGFEAGVGGSGPPPPDAGGYCGNEVHQLIVDAPNLYFVLDASGSMAELAPKGGNRYDAVRIAVVDLVRNLGPLANVGAALLPKKGSADECAAGAQVFPVTQGDPFTGKDGPTTTAVRLSTITSPEGGTPVSATLEALTPTLIGLSGETYVVIATDGGPNCNETAGCAASGCMLNIEGHPACDQTVNCCAPGQVGDPSFCVDEDATVAAIDKLVAAGLHVVVVGIPGSETYAAVLDAMAIAGGLPRPDSPKYHRVDQLDEVGSVLAEIAKVAVTCEFTLLDPPTEDGMTNVYLDGKVLTSNIPDGWMWKPPSTVRLLGDACDRVQTGKVVNVQIVSGCPTEIPKWMTTWRSFVWRVERRKRTSWRR